MGSKLKLVSSKFQLYSVLQNQMINMPMDDCLKGVHFMKSSNSNKHLTLEERKIIEQGIKNGSSKSAIAETLGKDKSTILQLFLQNVKKTSVRMSLLCLFAVIDASVFRHMKIHAVILFNAVFAERFFFQTHHFDQLIHLRFHDLHHLFRIMHFP